MLFEVQNVFWGMGVVFGGYGNQIELMKSPTLEFACQNDTERHLVVILGIELKFFFTL